MFILMINEQNIITSNDWKHFNDKKKVRMVLSKEKKRVCSVKDKLYYFFLSFDFNNWIYRSSQIYNLSK